MSWVLYLLECKNGHYYAGITNDLKLRFAAHLAGKGARYTRANPPVKILVTKFYADRSSASVAEAQLKKLPRHKKLAFFNASICNKEALAKDALLSAVQAALAGDWDKSHNIAQDYSDNTANWLHAVLHKIEGDEWNSKYWYARTHGKNFEDFSDATEELIAIQHTLC